MSTKCSEVKLIERAAIPPDGYIIIPGTENFDYNNGNDLYFSLTIEFEDYLKNRYLSVHTGIFNTKKHRIEIRSEEKKKAGR